MVRRAVAAALQALEVQSRFLLVAVSGGLDSVVLLHALHELSEKFSLKLSIGHVNHGLRGHESDADAEAVQALASRLGLRFAQTPVDPRALRAGGSSRARPTLQEAARRLRYAALARMADEFGADHIATGHTADDQAETVLLRLLRGSSPQGLGGIPERSPDGRVVRPLLRVSREAILEYARKRDLAWRDDSSNERLDYTRNRLRRDWLPGLTRSFNPRLLRALGDLAEAQRRDTEWIEEQVELELAKRFRSDGAGLLILARSWDRLPEALARRLVRRALRSLGIARDVSRVHIERVNGFLRNRKPGKRIELPGGLVLLARPGEECWLGPASGCVATKPPGAC